MSQPNHILNVRTTPPSLAVYVKVCAETVMASPG